jgi:aminomethyltransferase
VTTPEQLRRTPLFDAHRALGAKLVGFGGWEMPVLYSGIVEEHLAVRNGVGLFDISHMGEFLVRDAEAELNRLLTNDVRRLAAGQAQYTLLCHERGGILDDLITYRLDAGTFLLIVNAANLAGDLAWLRAHLPVEDLSDQTGAVALQGPAAASLLDLPLAHFHIGSFEIFGIPCRVARTGYTGEDGFEILCAAPDAERLWTELLTRGAAFGIKPCGLGARDTLRLEMGYPLHGNDLSPSTTPLEAGLGRYVCFDKGAFVGRAALLAQRAAGLTRRLVAVQMTEKAPPPRPHYAIVAGGRRVGELTSGAPSPSLGTGIGLGYVETSAAAPGTAVGIEIRGQTHAAVVATKPLWKKTR